MFVGHPMDYPGSDNKKFYYLKCYHVYSYYSLKLSLLGWLVILFTTWLTKIFVDPDLKSYFFLLPKCMSIDFATNHLDLCTLGPFKPSISLVSNFLKLQFLWGFRENPWMQACWPSNEWHSCRLKSHGQRQAGSQHSLAVRPWGRGVRIRIVYTCIMLILNPVYR